MIDAPWQLAPQLKKDHIQQLAQLLIKVRGEVIERHEPELGDTRLSLGMRAYECCRSQIIFKAFRGEWPWLSILTPTGRFTFAIENIPVRFTRNEPGSLPDRKLILSPEAGEQIRLFEDENRYAELRWFLVIDSAYDAPVENAYFVGYSPLNEIVCKWQIPLSDQVPLMSKVDEIETQPIPIPAAKAKLKLVKTKDTNSANDK
jgi:hypothetical protein